MFSCKPTFLWSHFELQHQMLGACCLSSLHYRLREGFYFSPRTNLQCIPLQQSPLPPACSVSLWAAFVENPLRVMCGAWLWRRVKLAQRAWWLERIPHKCTTLAVTTDHTLVLKWVQQRLELGFSSFVGFVLQSCFVMLMTTRSVHIHDAKDIAECWT